ncbi:MAG: oligosaccharide flippase family protein [Candidatus Schekmanbacteria bacterium]|nr:oligosaccharide flippase family protein [Candidatus Schekmanbacteria bacterium]
MVTVGGAGVGGQTPAQHAAADVSQQAPYPLEAPRRQVIRSAILYVAAELVGGIIMVALLPITTRYLTPSEFGVVAICRSIRDFCALFFTFGLTGAAVRYSYNVSALERLHFRRTVFTLMLTGPAVIMLGIHIVIKNTGITMEGETPYDPMIAISILTGYGFALLVFLPKEILKADGRKYAYSIITLAFIAANTLFTIALVAYFRLASFGIVVSDLLSCVAAGVVSSVFAHSTMRVRMDFSEIKASALYSAPLFVHIMCLWSMNFSDRLILQEFVGMDEIGLYSFAYQIAFSTMVVATGAYAALLPELGKHGSPGRANYEYMNMLAESYISFILFFSFLMTITARILVSVLGSDEYGMSERYIYWIISAYAFLGIYFPSITIISVIHGKTTIFGIATPIAAAINISANLIFIPRIGAEAAAISTSICYALLSSLYMLYAWSIDNKAIRIFRCTSMISIYISCVLTFVMLRYMYPSYIISSLSSFSLYIFLSYITGVFNPGRLAKLLISHFRQGQPGQPIGT